MRMFKVAFYLLSRWGRYFFLQPLLCLCLRLLFICSHAEADIFPLHNWGLFCASVFIREGRRILLSFHVGHRARTLLLVPFERLESASLEAVSNKTFVFIALALEARRGKIVPYVTASLSLQWKTGLSCYFSAPLFIPISAKGSFPLEPYIHRSLGVPHSAPPRDDATVLCPVRAFKAYMELTSLLTTKRQCFYH